MLFIKLGPQWILNSIFEILLPLWVNRKVTKAVQRRIQRWKGVNRRICSLLAVKVLGLVELRVWVILVKSPERFFVNFVCHLLNFIVSDHLASDILGKGFLNFLLSNRLQNVSPSLTQSHIFLSDWIYYSFNGRLEQRWLVVSVCLGRHTCDWGLAALWRGQQWVFKAVWCLSRHLEGNIFLPIVNSAV